MRPRFLSLFVVAATFIACGGGTADDATSADELNRDRQAPAAASGLAALPDGAYHVPSKAAGNVGGRCVENPAVFVVEKRGRELTVRPTQSQVTSTDLVGKGTVETGTFKGNSGHGADPYGNPAGGPHYPSQNAYYEMTGKLAYEGGALSLEVTYKGGLNFVTTNTFQGRISSTLFGQREDTLPAGVKRETLSVYSADACSIFDRVTLVRGADGAKKIALPHYVGDLATDDTASRAQYDCMLPPTVGQQGKTLYVSRQRGRARCFAQFVLPDWFVAP